MCWFVSVKEFGMFCIDCGKGGYCDLIVVVWFVGDSGVILFLNLGYYDFVMSDCVGNNVI